MLTRRAGPVGIALTAYDIWRRLPPKQRKQLLANARKHGPRIASAAVERTKARRPRPPDPRP
jgi:signal recognition particle receptor subunit beta